MAPPRVRPSSAFLPKPLRIMKSSSWRCAKAFMERALQILNDEVIVAFDEQHAWNWEQ